MKEIILVIGIGLWYLSRLRLRSPENEKRNETLKIYKILLIGAELFTCFIIFVQLFVWTGTCKLIFGFQAFGLGIFIFGVFLSILARYSLKENWATARAFAQPKRIIDSGPYAYIRHPIYLGSLLMGLGFELAMSSWLFFVVLIIGTPFIYICAYKEEQMLIKWMGQDYQDYKKKTSWFFPWIF